MKQYINCVIVIGTEAEEVEKRAKECGKFVITYENIKKMYLGCSKMPDYFSHLLQEVNLRNCCLLSDRLELLDKIGQDLKNGIVFAEIGVAFGDYSEEILKRCDLQKFYLVDAWEGERYQKGYETIREKFKTDIDNGVVEILKGYSIDKLKNMDDNSLDVGKRQITRLN